MGKRKYHDPVVTKKIYINGRFLTKPLSGVQRTAYELVKGLDNLIEDNVIDQAEFSFTLIYSGEIINNIELKNIQILRRGFLKGNLWEQFELPVYTFGSLLISLCTISTLFKRKQLVMVHDASFFINKTFFSSALGAWYRVAIPVLAKIARGMITVSEFSKNELIKYGAFKNESTTVIYNGADHILRFGIPAQIFIDKIEAAKPYCLAVSSLAANKNFDAIGRAINEIDFTGHKMLIAGGVMSTLKYSSLPENVLQLGYVSDAELKYLYSNAALFIFPSFYEGFGIPPLEAMILGCPVISSFTSSMPEVLGDACQYIDPASDADIADKISFLINDPKQREILRQKGLHRAARYKWKKSALELFELIKLHSA